MLVALQRAQLQRFDSADYALQMAGIFDPLTADQEGLSPKLCPSPQYVRSPTRLGFIPADNTPSPTPKHIYLSSG